MSKKKLNRGGVYREFAASDSFIALLIEKANKQQPSNEIEELMQAPTEGSSLDSGKTLQDVEDIVRECLEKLSPKQIEVINLIYYEQVTYREAANRLGYKYNNSIQDILERTIKELKEELLKNDTVRYYLGVDDEYQ